MANDFKAFLEVKIDSSSLSNVNKQLAKERLKVNADISFEDFAKPKQKAKKQITGLATGIKDILGNAVSNKQANQWAKQYYNQIISNAKQAAKEQTSLTNAMAKGREQAELARQAEEKRQHSEYSLLVSDQKRLSKANVIESWNRKNKNTTQEIRNANEAYITYLRDLSTEMTQVKYDEISDEFSRAESSMTVLGRIITAVKEQIEKISENIISFISLDDLVTNALDKISEMPQAVYEIDSAMTSLYKVTDEAKGKYDQFFDSVSSSAHDLGLSISSLIDQTAEWAALGFSLDAAGQLAKISSIYANVGEVDNAAAVSNIAAAMDAFNVQASDAMTIIDKLHKLGNEYTASSAALGDGLSRYASEMAAAGTDINKTLAMLTGGTEIIQNASEFGDFLKIGSMRIRGMKEALGELGEEVDQTANSISKIQTQIFNRTGGRVNIFDDIGNLRDYYDIMEDISKVYNDLSAPDKAGLTEILFGKQRGDQGAALMQAFQSGQIQMALEVTLNAEGSAMQEYEQWLESLEAKTQQFEAAFQSLSSTVIDSNILKWFVDFGTNGVQAIDSLISNFGSLGTIGLGAGLFAGVKNIGKCRISVRIS